MKLKLSSVDNCNLDELNTLWAVLTNHVNDSQIDGSLSAELVLSEPPWEFIPPLYLDANQECDEKYFLFYRNPIVGLGVAINQGRLLNDYINNWLGSARCLIGFQKLNRQNSLLIDYDAFLANPSAVIKHFNKIGITCNTESFPEISLPEKPTIDGHSFLTGSVLVGQHRELQQTLTELQASSVLFKDWTKPSLKQAFSAIEQYQGMAVQFQNQDQLVQGLMDTIEQKSSAMLLLESKSSEVQLQLTSANKVSEQLLLESNNKEQVILSLKERESENKLLLLQLHQTQEELEQIYLDKKALEHVTQESKALAEKQANTLTSIGNEAKELKQTISALQSEKGETQSENELLLLQLHQVQEELEYYYLDNEKYKNTVKKLKTRIVNSTANKEKTKVNKNELRALFNKEWYKKQAGKVFRPLSHYLSKGRNSQLNPHPLFDATYYIQHNHLENVKENPLIHFLSIGAINGLSPHPLFDAEWYMEMNPDLAEDGINPLVHYLKFGGFEERDPSPRFSSKAYLEHYPDVQQSEMNPLMHYIVFGQNEDRIIYPSRLQSKR